jgi:DnaJ-class molecular chaperone
MNTTERAAIVLQQIDAALKENELEICGQCSGAGVISYNPNLNPNSFPATATAKCNHCDGDGIAVSRALLPTSLRCLKTAIQRSLKRMDEAKIMGWELLESSTESELEDICDQWEER